MSEASHPIEAPRCWRPHDPLAGVVAQIGRPGFAEAALASISDVLGVGSWSAYALRADARPVLHLSASHAIADTTRACFAVYRDDGLYRDDSSFDPLAGLPPGRPMLLRMHADDAPTAAHRDAIYRRYEMVERLSVARVEADRSVLAVNVYHHRHRGPFDAGQIERFGALAPTLIAAVARHIEWQSSGQASSRARLRQRVPSLTERELDVLERLVAGMTYDGIADELALSLATVKTYRQRAFQRMNIHFRSQLFAVLGPTLSTFGPTGAAGSKGDTVAPSQGAHRDR